MGCSSSKGTAVKDVDVNGTSGGHGAKVGLLHARLP